MELVFVILIVIGFSIIGLSESETGKIVGCVISLMVIVCTIIIKENDGYRKGQIDAINGKIKYRLEKNSDSTTEWKEITK
jgi:hypothetical protein